MNVHVLKEMYVLKERYASSNVAETKLTAYKNRFILITVIASSTGQALYKSTSILRKGFKSSHSWKETTAKTTNTGINPFVPNAPFLYSLMFSVGRERVHWEHMG